MGTGWKEGEGGRKERNGREKLEHQRDEGDRDRIKKPTNQPTNHQSIPLSLPQSQPNAIAYTHTHCLVVD